MSEAFSLLDTWEKGLFIANLVTFGAAYTFFLAFCVHNIVNYLIFQQRYKDASFQFTIFYTLALICMLSRLIAGILMSINPGSKTATVLSIQAVTAKLVLGESQILLMTEFETFLRGDIRAKVAPELQRRGTFQSDAGGDEGSDHQRTCSCRLFKILIFPILVVLSNAPICILGYVSQLNARNLTQYYFSSTFLLVGITLTIAGICARSKLNNAIRKQQSGVRLNLRLHLILPYFATAVFTLSYFVMVPLDIFFLNKLYPSDSGDSFEYLNNSLMATLPYLVVDGLPLCLIFLMQHVNYRRVKRNVRNSAGSIMGSVNDSTSDE